MFVHVNLLCTVVRRSLVGFLPLSVVINIITQSATELAIEQYLDV